jgi:hypothetical protein
MTGILKDPEAASDSKSWQPLFDADDFFFEHDGYIVVHGWCTDVRPCLSCARLFIQSDCPTASSQCKRLSQSVVFRVLADAKPYP